MTSVARIAVLLLSMSLFGCAQTPTENQRHVGKTPDASSTPSWSAYRPGFCAANKYAEERVKNWWKELGTTVKPRSVAAVRESYIEYQYESILFSETIASAIESGSSLNDFAVPVTDSKTGNTVSQTPREGHRKLAVALQRFVVMTSPNTGASDSMLEEAAKAIKTVLDAVTGVLDSIGKLVQSGRAVEKAINDARAAEAKEVRGACKLADWNTLTARHE